MVSRSDPNDVASPHRLVALDVAKHTWADLELPSLAECQRTEYLLPERLSDGRIGALRRCIPLETSPDWPTWLIAVNVQTKAIEELTPNLSSGSVINISSYTWQPDLNEAVVSIGSRVCQTLQRVGHDGIAPIDMLITIVGRSFNLRDTVAPGSTDCASTGRADDPALSPLDMTMVFTASADAVGVSGPSRLDASSALMVLRPGDPNPRVLLRGVRDSVGVQFSPNGKCVGLGADLDGFGVGTFVVDIDSGRVVKVSDTAIAANWSPDGTNLAGGEASGVGPDAKQWLVILPASCALLQ